MNLDLQVVHFACPCCRSAMPFLSATLALVLAHALRTDGEHEIHGSTVWLTVCAPPCSEWPGSQQLTKPPAR